MLYYSASFSDKLNNLSLLGGCNKSVSCLDFDAEESHIMGGSFDCAIRIWSINDRQVRHSLNGHSDKVMATKFIGSSAKVASGSYDRTVKVWDLRQRSCKYRDSAWVFWVFIELWRSGIQTYFPGSSCNDVVVVEGTGIISGHFDKKLRFYDIRSKDPLKDQLLTGKITSLDLSAGKWAILSSWPFLLMPNMNFCKFPKWSFFVPKWFSPNAQNDFWKILILLDKTYLLVCTREDVLHYFDLRANRILHNYR